MGFIVVILIGFFSLKVKYRWGSSNYIFFLCLAYFMSFALLVYCLWLLFRSNINVGCAEVARKILKINMFLVNVVLFVLIVSKETVIGFGFLMYIVIMLFSIVLFVFFFQKKFIIFSSAIRNGYRK